MPEPSFERTSSNRRSASGRWSWLPDGPNEIAIHLPFPDKREWAHRDEILRSLTLQRRGDSIVCSLPTRAALRDRAATLALAHPAWTSAPAERDARYFPAWQGVSVALQAFLRRSIADEYFHEVAATKTAKRPVRCLFIELRACSTAAR